VDDRDIGDSDASRQGKENVAPSPRADGHAVSKGAGPSRDAGEAAEGWLKGRGHARTVHSMAQSGLCGQGGASHAVVSGGLRNMQTARASGCWGMGRHHTDTQAMPQGYANLAT
jgi:hypothetical protein